jgi:hypothetical protein
MSDDWAEAARVLRKLIPEETRIFGADHPITLLTRSELACDRRNR